MKSSLLNSRQASPALQRRSGFTLVELLVVITIIAMLAGLIAAVAFPAISGAKSTRIKVEISQIDMALKAYKQEYGAYPPSSFANKSAVERHISKAFPQHQEFNANWHANYATTLAPLTPAQALVFWLGGFSADPEFPLSGAGGPIPGGLTSSPAAVGNNLDRNGPKFEFDKSRLEVIDNPTSTITPDIASYIPQSGEGVPYVYFRSNDYVSSGSPAAYTFGSGTARPYPTQLSPLRWANPDSFQIISAGLDGDYGIGGVFPTGAGYTIGSRTTTGYTTDATGDLDNLTNFSERVLGDERPE